MPTSPTPPTTEDAKAGARNNASDLDRLQQIHDLAVANGAACGAGGMAPMKAANIAQLLESNIHLAFTMLADDLAAQGILTRAERIALSSAIGAALDTYNQEVSNTLPQLATRPPYGEAPPESEGDAPPETTPTGDGGVTPEMKAGALATTDGEVHVFSMKALGNREIEVQVAFGGPFGGKDSHGEFFSPRTDFDEANFPTPPAAYYHGFNDRGQPTAKPVFIGSTVGRETRKDGHYLRVRLNDTPEADRVYKAAEKGNAPASPGTIPWLRRKSKTGELEYWPIAEISVWDGANGKAPANPWTRATALKALYDEAGATLPSPITAALSAMADPTGRNGAGNAHAAAPQSNPNTGDLKMEREELIRILDERDAKAKADAEAAAARQQEIAAAVAAERQRIETEYAAKARRLPFGHQAPYQTHFSDTARFDHLSAGDLAFGMAMLSAAARKGNAEPPSEAACKALAIKIAEEKGDAGQAGRSSLKALGFDPADALNAAKANEVNYSTNSGFGDEFVPTIWGTDVWALVRQELNILKKIPTKMYSGPGDTFNIPLEGADMTWYGVAETSDIDGTTKRPNATVGETTMPTPTPAAQTFAKVGARVIYSGEYTEDSIVEWVVYVRPKFVTSFMEQLEYLVIDGDTATGATTNINHIGGTPTATGKRDLFLQLNGFRKLALVTNTANSRSAGTLTAEDYLETVKLLGTAGVNALDIMKVSFIQDPNVNWKALQLAEVKTRDVNTQATVENGRLKIIYGYEVLTSAFMHYKSASRLANSAGKVDQTTPANNTTGSILAVRWDQWFFAYKRAFTMKMQDIQDSDASQLIATARVGMVSRDNEAAAISYNVTV